MRQFSKRPECSIFRSKIVEEALQIYVDTEENHLTDHFQDELIGVVIFELKKDHDQKDDAGELLEVDPAASFSHGFPTFKGIGPTAHRIKYEWERGIILWQVDEEVNGELDPILFENLAVLLNRVVQEFSLIVDGDTKVTDDQERDEGKCIRHGNTTA